MRRLSVQRISDVEHAIYRIPLAPQLVDEAFAHFVATGKLPDDTRVAMHVAWRIQHGAAAGHGSSNLDWAAQLRGYLANGERGQDAVRDALIHEAIWETGDAKVAARVVLQQLVADGHDLTKPVFDGTEMPEFGTVGFAVLGYPEQFVGPKHQEQCERLVARFDILAREVAPRGASWHRSMRNAAQMFQDHGERPDEPIVLECVLALGEMQMFVEQIAGRDVDEDLAAFDAAFMRTGAERDAAIARLQAMAAAGRFRREER